MNLIIFTIQIQIRLTLPYPFKRQFYEDTLKDKYKLKTNVNWGFSYIRTQEGATIGHNGQKVSYKQHRKVQVRGYNTKV